MTGDAKSSRRGGENPIRISERSPSGERCARLSLRADLAELERVRDLVDDIQPLCGLSDSRAFDIKVALSEACANAIEHAGSAAVVVAWLLQDRVLFEVTNDGGFLPGLHKDTDQRRRGLGLPLMVSLADQVHVSRLENGITRVSLTFFLSPVSLEVPQSRSDFVPRLQAKPKLELEMRGPENLSSHQTVLTILEGVAAAPTLRQASSALLEGARGLTGCEGGMLRLRESVAARDGWLPAVVHSGLGEDFLREEALIHSNECMCGRVCMGLTDSNLPFFTPQGSFLWGRAQTIAAQFGTEALGEVRGRCIAEGFESVAVFPLAGQKEPIGVLHLVDRQAERFAATADTLEWACRVAGQIMAKGSSRERASAVRQAVRGLRAS